MKHGDFTELAEKYAKYRAGYAPFVCDAICALLPNSPQVADVGAGTGIWTRMLSAHGCLVTAVEPNDAMRDAGEKQTSGVRWVAAPAESTTLQDGIFDMVCMASSFHWTDFAKAVAEFDRITKPGGYFMALWNPRYIEASPLLMEIENTLASMVPELNRVSSGQSKFCDSLAEKLASESAFSEVLYLEGMHTEMQTPERYKGLWESVNDVRVQAGEERFAAFMEYIHQKTAHLPHIKATYRTRAWVARKPK